MTRPDHHGRSPRRRDDTTSTRPGGRRQIERRPWPTAPTTTRVSPGKPASGTTRSRSHGSASTPTPATVWTPGERPIDLDAAWPVALVEKVVSSFSRPGAHVVLLPWPTLDEGRPRSVPVDADGAIDHAPDAEKNAEMADAANAVERLGRSARVEHVPDESTTTGPASRPFWADLVGGTGPAPTTIPTTPAVATEADAPHHTTAPTGDADLVVTRLHPRHSGDRGADLVALFAARLLRVGGILVVLTHCDWETGELTDPTGAVVTAGQNADLLYLQHIVALHAPVSNGRFATESLIASDGATTENEARAEHRAAVRGLPAPHRRIHSDVLVFSQPHDHQPTPAAPSSAPTDAVPRPEDLR